MGGGMQVYGVCWCVDDVPRGYFWYSEILSSLSTSGTVLCELLAS